MAFQYFESIENTRQSMAQYCCVNIIGTEALGYCLDAHEYLPAGSTWRLEPQEDMTIDPFCASTRVWRG